MTTKLPDTSRSLTFSLLRAREALMVPFRNMLDDTGVTEQQWRVLRVLSEEGPMAVNKLAKKSILLMPSLSRIISTLVARQFVTRCKDVNDKRCQVITITKLGKKIIDDKSAHSKRIIEFYCRELGYDNYVLLLCLLDRLVEININDQDVI